MNSIKSPGSLPDKQQWYMYVIRTRDNTLYCGVSIDPERRFREHETGRGKGARYFHIHRPAELAYIEPSDSRGEALKAEHRFKKLSKNQKEEYIRQHYS